MMDNAPLKNKHYQLLDINGDQYALPVQCVVTVLALQNLLPLPATPPWLSGVVHIHNAIVPVVNLNKVVGSANQSSYMDYPFIVLLSHPDDPQRWLAVCVNDLTSVINKTDLADMVSISTQRQGVINTIQNQVQKIHFIDIVQLFEQLMQEQD